MNISELITQVIATILNILGAMAYVIGWLIMTPFLPLILAWRLICVINHQYNLLKESK